MAISCKRGTANAVLICAIVLGFVALCTADGLTDIPTYGVRRTSESIVVDGRLDEFDWTMAERIRFVKFRHQPEDHEPLRENTSVAGLWDDSNLYLAFMVEDSEIWSTITRHDSRGFCFRRSALSSSSTLTATALYRGSDQFTRHDPRFAC